MAVVTGGASGIAAATELRARGARVASLDLSTDAAADLIVRCDVTDENSVRAAVNNIASHFGRIDIVVNNAGIGSQATVEETPDADQSLLFQMNLLGTVSLTRAALPHLRRSPPAAVVNTGSIATHTGLQQRAAYSASKGPVHALTLAMAADHIPTASESMPWHPKRPTLPGCSDYSTPPQTGRRAGLTQLPSAAR